MRESEPQGRRIKIVRVIARLNVGGPARHVVWLTAGLQKAGCESVLVSGLVPPGEDEMDYFARDHGVKPLIIPQMSREISLKDGLTVWKLYRLFVRERPDVVHTHTAKAGTVGRVAGIIYRWLTFGTLVGRPRHCRFVHTYHGHIFHSYYGPLKTRIFLSIEKALARLVTNRIVTISPQQYVEIHEEFGVGSAKQFVVIPLGLDTAIFADWSNRRSAMRDELGASETDVLVGIVGRLTEIKNHLLFLKTVARYKEIFGTVKGKRRVRFIVIGDGHLRHELEAQARELGVDSEVTFTGTRNDPENFYPALDVVALTSLNEGTPLTLIEAMANARAVIATAVGGVIDLLGEKIVLPSTRNEDSGYTWRERGVLVRPNDATAFCEGLACLVEDEELRSEIGARARRFVEQNYSKERLVSDAMNLYQELMQDRQHERGDWDLKAKEKLSADSRIQTPDSGSVNN